MSTIINKCLPSSPHCGLSSPHADDHVNVAANSLGKCGEQVCLGWLQPSVLDRRPHLVQDAIHVLHGIDVGHIACVENVVNVLQERFALDLAVE